jgi:hypothetical protein
MTEISPEEKVALQEWADQNIGGVEILLPYYDDTVLMDIKTNQWRIHCFGPNGRWHFVSVADDRWEALRLAKEISTEIVRIVTGTVIVVPPYDGTGIPPY